MGGFQERVKAVAGKLPVTVLASSNPNWHHPNSRRFKCACSKNHEHWPRDEQGKPQHIIVCACGRRHYRDNA